LSKTNINSTRSDNPEFSNNLRLTLQYTTTRQVHISFTQKTIIVQWKWRKKFRK